MPPIIARQLSDEILCRLIDMKPEIVMIIPVATNAAGRLNPYTSFESSGWAAISKVVAPQMQQPIGKAPARVRYCRS